MDEAIIKARLGSVLNGLPTGMVVIVLADAIVRTIDKAPTDQKTEFTYWVLKVLEESITAIKTRTLQ